MQQPTEPTGHFTIIALYVAWVAALASFAGSLYFSEVLHFAPCVLCWYQRICMYPLLLIITIGILKRDYGAYIYALPLATIGAIIALYHNFLQWGLVSEKFAPCVAGVSCTTVYEKWLGFVTIPLLSLLAFLVVIISLLIVRRSLRA